MITVGAIKNETNTETNFVFSQYITNIKEKNSTPLLKEIDQLLTKATYESIKAKKIAKCTNFIEQPNSEENKKKLEPSIKCYFDEIKWLIVKIMCNESILEIPSFNITVKETKIDLLELKNKIKNKISEDFRLFYNTLNLQNNQNLFLVTEKQFLEVFSECIKQIEKQYIHEYIPNTTYTMPEKNQSQGVEKINLLSEMRSTLRASEKIFNTIRALNRIAKKALEAKKVRDLNIKNQSLNQTLKTFEESISNIEKEFIPTMKTFFELSDEEIKRKYDQPQYRVKCYEEDLIEALESILQSITENIESINSVLSCVKKVLETSENSNIELQKNEVCLLGKLMNANDKKIIRVLKDFSIKMKPLSLIEKNSKTVNYNTIKDTSKDCLNGTRNNRENRDLFGKERKKVKK